MSEFEMGETVVNNYKAGYCDAVEMVLFALADKFRITAETHPDFFLIIDNEVTERLSLFSKGMRVIQGTGVVDVERDGSIK